MSFRTKGVIIDRTKYLIDIDNYDDLKFAKFENEKIIINKNATINLALKQLKFSGTKCLVVLDKNKKLLGTLTDGDLRKNNNFRNTKGKINKIFNKTICSIPRGNK